MMKLIFSLFKLIIFIIIGVPLLFIALYVIGSTDVPVTQSNVDENLSREQQIAALEAQVEEEKLQAINNWEQIVRKAQREGNINKNRVLTSKFIDLNKIHTKPIKQLTETEKKLLNTRLQGNVVKFNGTIERFFIPESDKEILYRTQDNYNKTGVRAVTKPFRMFDNAQAYSLYDEAVYCTFNIFDEYTYRNFLKIRQNPLNKDQVPFNIKGDFVSISYRFMTGYGEASNRINLNNCLIVD